MKIFIDTANVKEIKEATALGIIDGVTTNPTLISREQSPAKELLKKEIFFSLISDVFLPATIQIYPGSQW